MPTIVQEGNEASNQHISFAGQDELRSSLPDGFMNRAQRNAPFTIYNEDNDGQFDGNSVAQLSRGKWFNMKISNGILNK